MFDTSVQFDKYFEQTTNPDGSTLTECMCYFRGDNRKCQFVAVRDPGGTLRRETLRDHMRKHHNEVFKEFDERNARTSDQYWEFCEKVRIMKDQESK